MLNIFTFFSFQLQIKKQKIENVCFESVNIYLHMYNLYYLLDIISYTRIFTIFIMQRRLFMKDNLFVVEKIRKLFFI